MIYKVIMINIKRNHKTEVLIFHQKAVDLLVVKVHEMILKIKIKIVMQTFILNMNIPIIMHLKKINQCHYFIFLKKMFK